MQWSNYDTVKQSVIQWNNMVLHLQGNTLVQVAPCGELPSSKPGAKLLQPDYSQSWCVMQNDKCNVIQYTITCGFPARLP